MAAASRRCPVPARAAAVKLESRGHTYAQYGVWAARAPPPGRISSRRNSSDRAAASRSAALAPGTVPAASQARYSAATASAAGSSGGPVTGCEAPGGR